MRYMIAPLDLNDEQSHIYKLLYKKSNFKTMIVKYTKGQLLLDSNPIFKLSPWKIRTILEYFLKEHLIKELVKGSKGNPTIYEIITIKELLLEQQSNDNQTTIKKQLNHNNDIGVEPVTEVEQQLNHNQTTIKPQLNHNPINEKEKEYVYTHDFLEWYSIYPNSFNKEQSFINWKKVTKIVGKEKILLATKEYIKILKSQNKLSDKEFITVSSNFVGDKAAYKGYLEIVETKRQTFSQVKIIDV